MKRRKLFLLVFLFLGIGPSLVLAYPAEYKAKMDLTKLPDFYQINAAFEKNGENYCAPTAAANSIWYFDKTLDENIVPDDNWIELVKTLAGEDYMNTDPDKGTTFNNAINGLDKYLDQKYTPGFTVASQFWSPNLDWIKEELSRCEDVLLWIGWWYYDIVQGKWIRDGGHAVTLAGYDATSFWISDPGNNNNAYDPYAYVAGTGYWEGFWELANYGGLNLAILEGAIAASPVPEPATMLLLGSGLIVFVSFRRKGVTNGRRS